jgi:hypothetical protein
MTSLPEHLMSAGPEMPSLPSTRAANGASVNGAAMAAVLAAGIGSFAVGFFVILNEAGVFTAPSLYGPAGGVSGRTTFAAVAWLIAWFVAHRRWRDRQVDGRRVLTTTLVLIALGLVLTFPPVWSMF